VFPTNKRAIAPQISLDGFESSRFDETSKQLVRELRVAVPAKGGQVERFDYEYKRNGVANLFMMCQPQGGWRHVEVTDRHIISYFYEKFIFLNYGENIYIKARIEIVQLVFKSRSLNEPIVAHRLFSDECV
jgi:hypothetical protein